MRERELQFVPLSQIDIGDRARKDYKNIDELANSIKEKGLIHPIAISEHPQPENGYKFLLLAGGRRFRAHEKLGFEDVHCRVYPKTLSDLEMRSIELEENIQREDLSWQEKVFLKREIHRLQISIHGEKVSKAPDAAGHSRADTAKMLGVSPGKISQDIALADAMEKFPEAPWNKCKNSSDAQKLKKKMEKVIVNDHLAAEAQKTIGKADKRLQSMYDAYVIGDFFEKVKDIPDGYFNIVEVDPPYGIDLKTVKSKRGLGANGLEDYNEVEAVEYPVFLAKLIKECYRVMAPDSYIIFWFGPDPWFELIAALMERVGFKLPRIPGIWVKPNGQTNSPTTRLASAYEMFFYGAKGNPQINKPGTKNTFEFTPLMPDLKRHPTQRPIELMVSLLETFARPGSRLLVPFAGSGVSLEAGFKANMHPLGFDLTKNYRDSYILHLKEGASNEGSSTTGSPVSEK